MGLEDTGKIIEGFNRTRLTCLVNITGGEPFYAPHFVELCEKLSKRHFISLNTNLTHKDVFLFGEAISPDRVKYISCSLHIQQRNALNSVDDFIEKYKFLEAKGFYVFASYVMYPPVIHRFKKDYEYFKSLGIILRPKVFRGDYNTADLSNFRILWRFQPIFKRIYPNAYSVRQKKEILAYIDQSEKEGTVLRTDHNGDPQEGRILDVSLDKYFIDGLPSFKGRYCIAGKSYVRMTPTGDVHRCHGGEHYLGNLFETGIKLFDKAVECPYDICRCPYLGYSYIVENNKQSGMDVCSSA